MNNQSIAQNRPFGTVDFQNHPTFASTHKLIFAALRQRGYIVVRDRGLHIITLAVKAAAW